MLNDVEHIEHQTLVSAAHKISTRLVPVQSEKAQKAVHYVITILNVYERC